MHPAASPHHTPAGMLSSMHGTVLLPVLWAGVFSFMRHMLTRTSACMPCREPDKFLPLGVPRILLSESDFHDPDRQDGGTILHLKIKKPCNLSWGRPFSLVWSVLRAYSEQCRSRSEANSPPASPGLRQKCNPSFGQACHACMHAQRRFDSRATEPCCDRCGAWQGGP